MTQAAERRRSCAACRTPHGRSQSADDCETVAATRPSVAFVFHEGRASTLVHRRARPANRSTYESQVVGSTVK